MNWGTALVSWTVRGWRGEGVEGRGAIEQDRSSLLAVSDLSSSDLLCESLDTEASFSLKPTLGPKGTSLIDSLNFSSHETIFHQTYPDLS